MICFNLVDRQIESVSYTLKRFRTTFDPNPIRTRENTVRSFGKSICNFLWQSTHLILIRERRIWYKISRSVFSRVQIGFGLDVVLNRFKITRVSWLHTILTTYITVDASTVRRIEADNITVCALCNDLYFQHSLYRRHSCQSQ